MATLIPISSAFLPGRLGGLLLSFILLLVPLQLNADSLEEVRERGSIRIAIADERPYGYQGQDGRILGAGPEIIGHVLEQLDIGEIDWVVTEFSNLMPGLEAGRFDMAAAEMAILPERCGRVLFSEPNTSYGEGLLVLASNPNRILGYEDFADRPDRLRVAVQAGTVQEEILALLGVPEQRIVTVQSPDEAVDAIIRGRADAFAATGMTVASLETRYPEVEVEFNFRDPIVDGEEVRYWGGFAFPKGADTLRDAVNEALDEIKKNGDWEQTLSRYGFLKKDILYSYRFDTRTLCQAGR
ncbi:ectoine/hydroxyectoine ABC transporter substrate-binding protein EhuB [Halomonas maura]|uniref:ectoine/hydroxyectoine ABC transporter substrate-binding protein EhuB n=1 Tax=Halomonas maura TaxID=117606 RepID=UPI0025B5AAC0|nr:ectoine/hydroxyectoine ABC transporter substrate-binding protein EhuB [Halomonas maura]MDN3554865.1 ectoine/hydroxyectoine ABC transporter substrate-binding protein EhuB [Halomonas maura]